MYGGGSNFDAASYIGEPGTWADIPCPDRPADQPPLPAHATVGHAELGLHQQFVNQPCVSQLPVRSQPYAPATTMQPVANAQWDENVQGQIPTVGPTSMQGNNLHFYDPTQSMMQQPSRNAPQQYPYSNGYMNQHAQMQPLSHGNKLQESFATQNQSSSPAQVQQRTQQQMRAFAFLMRVRHKSPPRPVMWRHYSQQQLQWGLEKLVHRQTQDCYRQFKATYPYEEARHKSIQRKHSYNPSFHTACANCHCDNMNYSGYVIRYEFARTMTDEEMSVSWALETSHLCPKCGWSWNVSWRLSLTFITGQTLANPCTGFHYRVVPVLVCLF